MSPYRQTLAEAVVATAIAMMVFTAWPGLDLAVSGLFHDADTGFWLARLEIVKLLRELVWKLIVLTFFCALVALAFTKAFRSTAPALDKVWEVIVLTYLLGPMLLTDVLLKSHWGRARPSDVAEFGGSLRFTPALLPTDQCPSNCSFVSGEGSGATAMLIAALLVARNQVPGRWTRPFLTGAVAAAVLGLCLRVLMGRHFLSDTVLAALFVSLIALALLQLPRYRGLRLF